MSKLFEELDYCPTPIGPISLRRRREPVTGTDIFEVKLGDEHLMSTMFTASEIALGTLGTAACQTDMLDIVVGGLGLGYTAQAVLSHPRTRELLVVEFLAPVIEWHREGLVPLGQELTADPRCRYIEGDFFALSETGTGFDPDIPHRRFDAILVDIDHSPDAILDDRSSGFYRPEGLTRLMTHLKPGGVFGLWSNDEPDARFTTRLCDIFAAAWAEPVTFDNPLMGNQITQTVYLARTAK